MQNQKQDPEIVTGGIREGGKALIVQHCAVFGDLETSVRKWWVTEPAPYAQYSVAVGVHHTKPQERRSFYFTMKPDDIRYLTVIQDGQVVYDSRSDVPCDMAKWQETRDRFCKDRAIRTTTIS